MICGDFNSQPGSHVHRYLVNGFVNGKMAAPWNHVLDKQKEDGQGHVVAVGVEGGGLAGAMDHLSLDEMTTDSQPPPTVRYLLDFTLNRFTRWLRILGIDAALETEDEEKRRTKDGDLYVFERVFLCVHVLLFRSMFVVPTCSRHDAHSTAWSSIL